MAANLAIDDALLSEALKEGGLKTKKDTVNAALREYIQRRKQVKILELFGTIDFDPAYDHKKIDAAALDRSRGHNGVVSRLAQAPNR